MIYKAEQKTPLSFCTSKYYAHICSAKTSTESYPYRELRLMLTNCDGLFLCPYTPFSWLHENGTYEIGGCLSHYTFAFGRKSVGVLANTGNGSRFSAYTLKLL
jgi:hypothetical protein